MCSSIKERVIVWVCSSSSGSGGGGGGVPGGRLYLPAA